MNTIEDLKPNEVFVFGSNAKGNHAGGAARQAVERFGAVMGQAKGLQGQSYAIVTLDEAMQRVPLEFIGEQLRELNDFALQNPDKRFLLTLIGCGIAGFNIADIKSECVKIEWAGNVAVPFEFQNKTFIKGFDKNLCCRGFRFVVGQEYWLEPNGELELCSNKVFHFCESLSQVHAYYSCNGGENRFCEIEALGEIVSDSNKCGARGIKILREITGGELRRLKGLECGNTGLFNTGLFNTGDRNTGDFNTGDFNTGYRNTGYRNTGDRNTGDFNTGNFNTGNFNTGYRNTGYRNPGDFNTGYRNPGDFNTGDRNTGDFNTGDFNTGDFNTGDRNTGDFNTGYRNNGVFCTRQFEDTITIFDAPSSMTWEDWRLSAAYKAASRLVVKEWVLSKLMTAEEKKGNPDHEQLGGFLRTYTYHEAWRNLWAVLSADERDSIKGLPNFDAKKFEFITGINVEKDV